MGQYKALSHILRFYWKSYGGWKAVVGSPYFHVSIVGGIAVYPLWVDPKTFELPSITLGMLPNILGFSIGAFAIILSFGQESLERLKDKDEAKSKYISVTASFVHFIIIQTLALFVALIAKAWPGKAIGCFCAALTFYALLIAIASAFRLFRLARIYNQFPWPRQPGAANSPSAGAKPDDEQPPQG